jgi:hypothetical protein
LGFGGLAHSRIKDMAVDKRIRPDSLLSLPHHFCLVFVMLYRQHVTQHGVPYATNKPGPLDLSGYKYTYNSFVHIRLAYMHWEVGIYLHVDQGGKAWW